MNRSACNLVVLSGPSCAQVTRTWRPVWRWLPPSRRRCGSPNGPGTHHARRPPLVAVGAFLWANTHLLFWLSLIPFATAWLNESQFAPVPTAIYGVSLLMPAMAFSILQAAIIRAQGRDSELRHAVRADWKGKVSILAYMLAIALAFVDPRLPLAVCVVIALLWLVPDRRIERRLPHKL